MKNYPQYYHYTNGYTLEKKAITETKVTPVYKTIYEQVFVGKQFWEENEFEDWGDDGKWRKVIRVEGDYGYDDTKGFIKDFYEERFIKQIQTGVEKVTEHIRDDYVIHFKTISDEQKLYYGAQSHALIKEVNNFLKDYILADGRQAEIAQRLKKGLSALRDKEFTLEEIKDLIRKAPPPNYMNIAHSKPEIISESSKDYNYVTEYCKKWRYIDLIYKTQTDLKAAHAENDRLSLKLNDICNKDMTSLPKCYPILGYAQLRDHLVSICEHFELSYKKDNYGLAIRLNDLMEKIYSIDNEKTSDAQRKQALIKKVKKFTDELSKNISERNLWSNWLLYYRRVSLMKQLRGDLLKEIMLPGLKHFEYKTVTHVTAKSYYQKWDNVTTDYLAYLPPAREVTSDELYSTLDAIEQQESLLKSSPNERLIALFQPSQISPKMI